MGHTLKIMDAAKYRDKLESQVKNKNKERKKERKKKRKKKEKPIVETHPRKILQNCEPETGSKEEIRRATGTKLNYLQDRKIMN